MKKRLNQVLIKKENKISIKKIPFNEEYLK